MVRECVAPWTGRWLVHLPRLRRPVLRPCSLTTACAPHSALMSFCVCVCQCACACTYDMVCCPSASPTCIHVMSTSCPTHSLALHIPPLHPAHLPSYAPVSSVFPSVRWSVSPRLSCYNISVVACEFVPSYAAVMEMRSITSSSSSSSSSSIEESSSASISLPSYSETGCHRTLTSWRCEASHCPSPRNHRRLRRARRNDHIPWAGGYPPTPRGRPA